MGVELRSMRHSPLCGLPLWIFVSTVLPFQVRAQQSSPAVATSAYPNNADGLRQLLNNMLFAARREDPLELQSMIREMEIPNYQSWFTSNFGQEKGENWGEPYGRWLAKDEKEFQGFFARLAHMEGEFLIESLDSAKTWGSLNGPLDAYRAKWHRHDTPKGDVVTNVGDFYFIEGKFRWFTEGWQHDPFQKPNTGSIVPGKFIKQVQANYPQEARERKIEGTVKLQITMEKDGSVTVQNVVEGDPVLASAAVEAVRRWRCEPWQLNGQPISLQTTIDVSFTLKH
ncbi:MAG: energy transducer TonB [Candidatus Acidiferrum sp.]